MNSNQQHMRMQVEVYPRCHRACHMYNATNARKLLVQDDLCRGGVHGRALTGDRGTCTASTWYEISVGLSWLTISLAQTFNQRSPGINFPLGLLIHSVSQSVIQYQHYFNGIPFTHSCLQVSTPSRTKYCAPGAKISKTISAFLNFVYLPCSNRYSQRILLYKN